MKIYIYGGRGSAIKRGFLYELCYLFFFFFISKCFTHFTYKITLKTKKIYQNKQQHKNKTLVSFENDKGETKVKKSR